MYEIVLTDLVDNDTVTLGVSPAGAHAIAALMREAITERHETMHGPIVADVMRFVTGLERIV